MIVISSCTIPTIRRPTICAKVLRLESAAGIAAFVGRPIPSASTMLAIVDAVPIVIQCPEDRALHASAPRKSSSVISPVLTMASNFQTWVPDPMRSPRYTPFSIGPPDKASVGTPQLAAPMRRAGVVLSQPTRSTTPSIGLARIDSSTSMLTKLRNSMAVGRINVSPVEVTGNSRGNPPASKTPRFTFSANSRK